MVQDIDAAANRIGCPAAIRRRTCNGWSKNLRQHFRRPAFSIFVCDPACTSRQWSDRNQSDLVLQFHHAACDGVGALDFVTDLLTAYANTLAGATQYRFKPLDPSRLRDRGALPLSGRETLHVGSAGACRVCSRLWALLPTPTGYRWIPHRAQLDGPGPPPAYPEAYFHHFTSEESAARAGAARASEVSRNRLLARDLFLALARWGQRDGLSDSAWLRLMLPINMRSPSDRCLPAANVVSTVFLDGRLSDGRDAGALLHGVNRLMEDVKRHNLGLAWLLALRVLQFMPRAWARVRGSRRRCLTSALLTNFGPVLAASPLPRAGRRLIVGDMILEQVEIVPAARPLQCLAFAVNTYAGRMSVGMRLSFAGFHSGEGEGSVRRLPGHSPHFDGLVNLSCVERQ